ncbi:hypothetical protein BOTBODRAFT_167279 [Botryobasidium botryosum FD-172 SS1]|uniref:2-(3-amino-3-carboxypropyl)histidine synthase subunit 2 n=1 Tax=Botryobasidium botryosum (strain FD-172 SS1) TaxID=930990 RepID=A0A067M5P3_BOTB1|nr:hypothetical protein BOTBODRAFT_167279 [Botryobasidium botryosum FD-172 SS1]
MLAGPTAFSSSAQEVISRPVAIAPASLGAQCDDPAQLEHLYGLPQAAQEIQAGDYKRVALQFPDELLPVSVPIFRILKTHLEPDRQVFILADTSYGSCCVDEVAAQHVNADVVVHFGHACLTPTSRLPVIYAFSKQPIDILHCVHSLTELSGTGGNNSSTPPHPEGKANVLVKYDVMYAHQSEQIRAALQEAIPAPISVSIAHINLHVQPIHAEHKQAPASEDSAPPLTKEDQPAPAEVDNFIIFYIGGESLGLSNLLITHPACSVYSYNPLDRSARTETGRSNKALMRRYATVQKARDADVFGILVGTLGIASYLPLISRLREILARGRKKSYTISVGKLNPAKLANFVEIECFVLVACPENSLIDNKEFMQPIVTPYELELALSPEPRWTGRLVLDFKQILSEAAEAEPRENGSEEEFDNDQPAFSLMTGKYRHAKKYGGPQGTSLSPTSGDGALTLRNQGGQLGLRLESPAAEFLQGRTFQGLERRLDEDTPSILEQGRSGIARGYSDDRHLSTAAEE